MRRFLDVYDRTKSWVTQFIALFPNVSAKEIARPHCLGLGSTDHPLPCFTVNDEVDTIVFNPLCFGCPYVWHDRDKYKATASSNKNDIATLGNPDFVGKEHWQSVALGNFRAFLSLRPLRTDMERWLEHWDKLLA